jgi:hypothetical protein
MMLRFVAVATIGAKEESGEGERGGEFGKR